MIELKQEIAVQLLWVLGAIFSTAAIGLLINWAIRGRSAGHTSMGTRFAAEALALAAVWIPAYLGGPWMLALAVVVGCLCAAELYGTFEFGGDTPWKLSGILLGLFFLFYAYTRPGEIALEPFSGSGSQIIAAEKLGRRCYAMELSPGFVDVAVKRWEGATGERATLEATGAVFAEVAAEREVGAACARDGVSSP